MGEVPFLDVLERRGDGRSSVTSTCGTTASRPYADFMGYTAPWYSARDAGDGLLAGRNFGWLGCYVRDDHGRVYETYWTTGRGNEAGFWSYSLLDRTVFGRQEAWEDSPDGWPKIPSGQHQWRTDGLPLAQWGVTDEPARRQAPLRPPLQTSD